MVLGYIDPLQTISQLVTLALVVVVVAFMLKHRDRVMIALTGDDRLHGDPLDCVDYVFFRCGGTCSGDWTRCLTRFTCCPKRFRNINLVTRLARTMGVTSYTVELKNIVIGDLPVNNRRDYFIQVECSSNPPMVTSLAEDQLPKVVHFPEILTCRVRWSLVELPVKISVKALDIFGSTDICSTYIPAMQVIDWSRDPEQCVNRLVMQPASREDGSRETPPWILVEFGEPADDRDLDNFHNTGDTVRTATHEGVHKDHSIKQFKFQYSLLDPSGHAMQEPLEDDLESVECMASCCRQLERIITFFGFFVLVVPTISIVYAEDCYHRYKRLQIAASKYPNQQVFSAPELKIIAHQCHEELDGTGVVEGKHPCRPSVEMIEQMCQGRTFDNGTANPVWPAQQPEVLAFRDIINQVTHVNTGLPCNPEVCKAMAEQHEAVLAGTVSGPVLFLILKFGIRWLGQRMVSDKKKSMQRLRADQARKFHEQMGTSGSAA